jgi:peptidyl-prolyl cis-trans isomerase C
VPEFSAALVKLKKGEMTDAPVKTQFGYHIIKLEDTREAQFPAFEEVKAQVMQKVEQEKLQKYQESLRKAAKTDYKFTQQ